VTHCQALYRCGQSVDWPDCSLLGRWHLNSRRVPIPPVPRFGLDRVTKIRRRRALMSARLRADPAFGYDSQWWDNFGPRERDPVRRAAFLGEADPNPFAGVYMPEPGSEPPQREPFIEEMEVDTEEAPPEVHVKQEVSGDDIPGEEPRDDMEDFCGCVAYGILDAMERGEAPPSPPPMTEEEQLRVALLVSE
jgi:hypothetical protein